MTSSSGTHCFCTASDPLSTRIMSSRLATRRVMRRDSPRIVSASSRRVSADSVGPESSRLLAAPSMLPSGVRRSCDRELRRLVRRRSASTSMRLAWFRSASAARSSATAAWRTKDSSCWRRFGIGDVPRITRLDSHHAEDRLRGLEGKVERRRGWKRARAQAGHLAVVEGPARDAVLAPASHRPVLQAGRSHGRRTRPRCGEWQRPRSRAVHAPLPAPGSAQRHSRSAVPVPGTHRPAHECGR